MYMYTDSNKGLTKSDINKVVQCTCRIFDDLVNTNDEENISHGIRYMERLHSILIDIDCSTLAKAVDEHIQISDNKFNMLFT